MTNSGLAWLKEAVSDYKKLDGSQKVQVDKGLEKIKNDPDNAGKPLAGNLIMLREIKMKRLGLRIIFMPTDEGPIVAEIIVIGKRSDDLAFKQAARRINL